MALALDDARLGAATDAWLLYRVWSFMSGAELARSVMPVCKRWNALARDVHATRDADGPADQLWTTLLHRDFPMAPRIVALARAPPAVATELFTLHDDAAVPTMDFMQLYRELYRRFYVMEEPQAQRASNVGVIAECVQQWAQLQATLAPLDACSEALRRAAVHAQEGQAALAGAQSSAVALGHLQCALWLMAAALPLLEQHQPAALPAHLPAYLLLFVAKADALRVLGYTRVAAGVLRLGWNTGHVLQERLAERWPAAAAVSMMHLGSEIPYALLWARHADDATEARHQLVASQCARLRVSATDDEALRYLGEAVRWLMTLAADCTTADAMAAAAADVCALEDASAALAVWDTVWTQLWPQVTARLRAVAGPARGPPLLDAVARHTDAVSRKRARKT